MTRLEPSGLRALLHQVSNLVAVVQTQTEAARAEGRAEAAWRALELIEECARRTQRELQAHRAAGA